MLAEFASVVDAVRCAGEIQREMADRDLDLAEDRRLRFRIGVNLGDVIADGDDIYGDGVNIAARLEGLAAPGGICVSGTVRDHIGARLPYAFKDMGEQTVKNIARPVRVYAWCPESTTRMPTTSNSSATSSPPPAATRPSIVVLPFTSMHSELRLALAGLAATGDFTFLALTFPNISRWVTIPGALISFALTLYFLSPQIHKFHLRQRYRIIATIGAAVCVVGFAGFATIYFWPSPREAITLRYLYDHDYGNYLTQGKDYTMGLVEIPNARITFSVKTVLDFEHRAKWLYSYIPMNNGTFRACQWLIDNADNIINELEREVSVTNDTMLGTGVMSTKDLIFSRRIYVYHELPITDKDRIALESDASKSNLNVVFRGLIYLQDHNK